MITRPISDRRFELSEADIRSLSRGLLTTSGKTSTPQK